MSRILALGESGPIADHLRQSGIEVLTAPAKVRALGLARDLNPDLLLLTLPEASESEFEFLRELRDDPIRGAIPVVLILGKSTTALVARGFDLGAWFVLDEQASTDLADLVVRSALRYKQLRDELIAKKQREAVVELAGAVAHRMNQPLTSMSVIVETLSAAQARGDLSPERLLGRLEELQRLVERIAVIVKQVSSVGEYETTDYVGGVKIVDLDSSQRRGKRT